LQEARLKVTNTPDVLTDDVADVAVALIMMTGPRLRAAQSLRDGARMEEARTGAHDEARRQDGRHSGIGTHRKAIAERVSAMG
jgi:lactate dehydrogenase-like 2-hydroxyacid dehydrogenase